MSRNNQRGSLQDFFPDRQQHYQKRDYHESGYHSNYNGRGRYQKNSYSTRPYNNNSYQRTYNNNYRNNNINNNNNTPSVSKPKEVVVEPVIPEWKISYDPELATQQHHLDSNGDFVYDKSKSQLDKPAIKATFDPELTKEKSKGSSIIYKKVNNEELIKSTDPRLKSNYKDIVKSFKFHKRKPALFKSLPFTKFSFDKHSIGPPPPCEIIISGLGRAVSDIYLRNQLKSFGEILEDEIILDPESGIPLGLLRIKFGGSIDKASKAAKVSVESLDKTKVDGHSIRVRLNKDGHLLEKMLKNIRIQQKINKVEEKTLPTAPKAVLDAISKQKEAKYQQTEPNVHPSPQPSSIAVPAPPKPIIPNVGISKNDELKKIKIPQDLEKYIKNRSFIFIASKYIKNQINRNDVKKALETYDWTRVLDDQTGIFIVFNSPKEAKRCYQLENGKKVFTINLYMELQLPDDYNITAEDEHYLNTQRDVVEESTSLLTKELEDALQKDIRSKIIAPAVLEFLNINNFPELKLKLEEKEKEKEKEKQKEKERQLAAAIKTESTAKNEDDDQVIDVFSLQKKIPKLPSFKKKEGSITVKKEDKKLSPKKTKRLIQKKKLNLPLNYSLNFDEENDSDFREPSVSTPQLEKSHEELINEPPKKKAKKATSKNVEHILFSSSSEDEDEEDEEEETKISTKESTPTTPEEDKMDIDVPIKSETQPTEEDEDKFNLSSFDTLHKPTKTELPINVYEEIQNNTFNLNDFKEFVKDDEDIQLLKEFYKDEIVNEPIQLDLNYWTWREKNLINSHKEITKHSLSIPKSLQNSTGSHKSQGYNKIPDEVKAEYLPHRRRIHDPLSTIQVDNEENDSSKVQSSRTNRSNNRRFQYEVSNFNTENEILTMNQLNKRKKPVSFARSAIHNWGLYALEPIAEREMIIEYVGERIRQQVAEFREKSYLKSGIGSSYLFRVDENTVIDATKKGGIARFINHCCVPSCTAKIIKVEGQKRIVIYALRDIAANEELTYDYKFERETNDDERVRCLCGAPGCKGYLN